MPFRASVSDSEPVLLAVLLGLTAGSGSHCREFASAICRKLQPVVEKSVLSTLISAFGDRARTGKNTDVVVDKQHAGGDRVAVKFGEERKRSLTPGADAAKAKHEISEAFHFGRPAQRGRRRPELGFGFVNEARRKPPKLI